MNLVSASNQFAKYLSAICAAGALMAAQPASAADTDPAGTQEDRSATDGVSTSRDAVNADDGFADEGGATTPADRTTEVNRTGAADRTAANEGAMYFSEVDNSNDYRLTWDEVRTSYEQELSAADWNREEFLDEFDTDGDEFLDEDEYSEFLSEVGLEEPENRSSFIDIDVE